MNLTDKEKREFISIVNSNIELERLADYLYENNDFINSLCVEQSGVEPFKANFYSTVLLINIIEGFKNGKIIKK